MRGVAKGRFRTQRRTYTFFYIAIVILGISAGLWAVRELQPWRRGVESSAMSTSNDGIEILGTRYSPRLRLLYNTVVAANRKPVEFVEISGHVDNQITVQADKIIVGLHRGASEDDVAHEFMHAIMQAEGYPQPFSLTTSAVSQRLIPLISADFDHLVINEKLLRVGYDARHGFLTKADSYQGVLKLSAPPAPDSQAILTLGILHELLKFHYYIGTPGSQEVILARFPGVGVYWQALSSAIQRLPRDTSPPDMWQVVRSYVHVVDRVSGDFRASFRFSDLIGFEPVPMAETDLGKPAKSLFRQQAESIGSNMQLLRTFTHDGILVGAALAPNATINGMLKDVELPARDFAKQRGIRLLILH